MGWPSGCENMEKTYAWVGKGQVEKQPRGDCLEVLDGLCINQKLSCE